MTCGDMTPFLFAEDTALLVRDKSLDIINDTLQRDFDLLCKWFTANKLSLNAPKMKSMLLCNKHSYLRNFSLDVAVNSTEIESVDHIKYLGVYIDRHLSFDELVNHIIKKWNQRDRLLWKIRSCIPESLAKYLYKTLINPLFAYGDFVYDGTSMENEQKLQICQNNFLRAIQKCAYDYSIAKLHDELEIDTLATGRKKSSLKMVHRGLYNTGPEGLNNIFNFYQPKRALRSECQFLTLPTKTKTKFGDQDLVIRGNRYWNSIALELRQTVSHDQFKYIIKKYGSISTPKLVYSELGPENVNISTNT